MSNNLLDRFPNALNNLFSLEELELGRNRIHRFESGDFEVVLLQGVSLIFSHLVFGVFNPLKCFPERK